MAFDYGALAGSVLGAGSSIFGASQMTKSAKEQAKIASQNNATALELAKINQQTELMKLQGNQGSSGASSNTTLYVALGVGGVLILGLTIFAVTRK